MSAALSIEQIPLGDPRLRELVAFPWRLYRSDPCWTPPLTADLLGNRLLGITGLLTAAHPYHRDAEVTHFLARRAGNVVGTISAAVNRRFNAYYDPARIGFFGFFEVVDDDAVAAALLDAARTWLAARGMRVMRGPGQYSTATHERQGVLVEGFASPPTVELTHNFPYYSALLERYGFTKAKDYVAYMLPLRRQPTMHDEALGRLAAAARERYEITTRPAVLEHMRAEVKQIVEIYNEAWADNWGFLPLTQGEADLLADMLRPIVDPHIIRFAFVRGEPAAVLGALPDPYWSLRPRWHWYGDGDAVRLARLLIQRRRIPRARAMFFGVRPAYRRLGVDVVLFDELLRYGQTQRYTECELSMLLEDNALMLRACAHIGGRAYKRWRIYEMPLEEPSRPSPLT